jgi:TP901 family phage tail tape measure protein
MAKYDVTLRMLSEMAAAKKDLASIKEGITGIGSATGPATRSLDSFQNSLEEIAPLAQRTFVGITAGITGATAAFGSYEREMRNVQNISGETDAVMASLTDRFLALPPTLGEADDLMRALYQTISSGVTDADEAFQVVVNSAKTAKGNLADMTITVDGLTSIMNSFGIGAEDSMQVLDAMTRTVDLGKLTFEELANNIGKASAIANSAGVEYEELLATLATLTLNGLSVEESMTAIRAVLTNTLAPAQQVTEAMNAYGVEMSVATLQSEGLAGMMGMVAEAVQGNAEATAELFPNVRALTGAMALASEEGGEVLVETLEAIQESAGKVESNLANVNRTVKANADAMIAEWKKVGIVFGEITGEAFLPIAQGLTGIGTALKNLDEPTRSIIVQNGLFLTGLAGVLSVAPKVVAGLRSIAGAFVTTEVAAGKATVAVKGFSVAMGAAVVAGLALQHGINALAKHIDETSTAMNKSSIAHKSHADAFGEAMQKNGASFTEYSKVLKRFMNDEYDMTTAVRAAMVGLVEHGNATEEMKQIVADYYAALEGGIETEKKSGEATRENTETTHKAEAAKKTLTEVLADLQAQIEENNSEIEIAKQREEELHESAMEVVDARQAESKATLELKDDVAALYEEVGNPPDPPPPTVFQLWERYIDELAGYFEQTLSNAVTAGITGDFDSIGGLFEDFADGMAGILRDAVFGAVSNVVSGDMTFSQGMGSLFGEGGFADTNPLMAGIGGAGMVYQGYQQGGAGGFLSGAMGGAMSGAAIGLNPAVMAATGGISAIAGPIIGAVVGGVASLFGGKDEDPWFRFGISGGQGDVHSSGGHLGFNTEKREVFERQMNALLRDMETSYISILQQFDDTALIQAFSDSIEGSLSEMFDMDFGKLEMKPDEFAQWFGDVWLPEQMERVFGPALYAGLDAYGVEPGVFAQIRATLQQLPSEDQIEGLSTYIGAVVQSSRLLEDMDWDQLVADATQTGREAFVDAMTGSLHQIDVMISSIELMDPVQAATQAQEIFGLIESARQAEIEYLRQIQQMADAMADSIAAQREDLYLGGLSGNEQASYLATEIGDIFAQLESGLLSPDEVANLTADAQSYISMLQSVMGEEGLSGRMADILVDYFGNSFLEGGLGDLFEGGVASGQTGRDFLIQLLDMLDESSSEAMQGAMSDTEAINAQFAERVAALSEYLLTLNMDFRDFAEGPLADGSDAVYDFTDQAYGAGDALADLIARLNGASVGGQTIINIDPNMAGLIQIIEEIVAGRTGGTGTGGPGGMH